LHLKESHRIETLSHYQELESLGFEWDSHSAAWDDRLSELAASWVANKKIAASWISNQMSQLQVAH
jgi:hypothetical protein